MSVCIVDSEPGGPTGGLLLYFGVSSLSMLVIVLPKTNNTTCLGYSWDLEPEARSGLSESPGPTTKILYKYETQLSHFFLYHRALTGTSVKSSAAIESLHSNLPVWMFTTSLQLLIFPEIKYVLAGQLFAIYAEFVSGIVSHASFCFFINKGDSRD